MNLKIRQDVYATAKDGLQSILGVNARAFLLDCFANPKIPSMALEVHLAPAAASAVPQAAAVATLQESPAMVELLE